ncbi:TM2 domain-containing protein [Thiohalocapsa halophila]|nr:TM2 domain-containing protein [Thiohalocapsa halophila]
MSPDDHGAPMTRETDTHSVLMGYLLWIFGFMGAHRFYLGKWLTGIIWLLTGGLFLLGYLYDYWTLNEQIDAVNEDLGMSLPSPGRL